MGTVAQLVGVDLAKNVFSICVLDGSGRVHQRKELRRPAFAIWLAQLPANTVVAMEACSGAHHWARRCQFHGLEPRLMAAQFVTPFRKSQSVKNDRNDAEAIATAARQGNMRFVPVKTVAQQARHPVQAGRLASIHKVLPHPASPERSTAVLVHLADALQQALVIDLASAGLALAPVVETAG